MSKLRVILLLVLASPACWSTYNAGRCDRDSDCASGLVCNLEPTLEGNGRCVSPDAGQPDGGAGAAGQGEGGVGAAGTGGVAGTGAAGSDGGVDSDGPIEVAPEVKPPECISNSECPAEKPICDSAGACRRCDAPTVGATACAGLDAMTPACGSDGRCVGCNTSGDCKADAAKPICDVAMKKCVACTTDSQCVAKLGANPGVCMAHQNGRCATDAETFYVSNKSGCSDSGTSAGTAVLPFCSLEPVVGQASEDRGVVVVRGGAAAATSTFGGAVEISLIGQQGAVLISTGPYGLKLGNGARLYARALTVTAPVGLGISAAPQSTLRLDRVIVSNSSKGGIQLSGAAFDITNATVSGNGPAFEDSTAWGGLLIQFPPAAGPTRLNLVTVQGNKSVGIVCTGSVTGTGVFSMGNQAGEIVPSCGFKLCEAAGIDCGAQP